MASGVALCRIRFRMSRAGLRCCRTGWRPAIASWMVGCLRAPLVGVAGPAAMYMRDTGLHRLGPREEIDCSWEMQRQTASRLRSAALRRWAAKQLRSAARYSSSVIREYFAADQTGCRVAAGFY